MGKPSKKSLAKVEAAPVVAAPVKPGKKGKRDADEVVAKVANAKKQKLQVKKKKQEPSDSDASAESEEEQQVKGVGNNALLAKAPAVESDGDDSEGSSGDEEVKAPAKTVPAAAPKKDVSESDGDSSEEEETVKAGNAAVTIKGKVESSEDDDDSEDDDESDDDEEKVAAKTVASKKETEASDDDDSSENESEESDEEMPDAKSPMTVTKQSVKPSEKNVPKTPVTQATGSKTLFMGNLPFKIEQEDIITFFKEAGAEVYEVRIGMDEDGRSKGFGHVEFATPEDAQKGLKLNGTNLLDRPVRLDLAREKGEYTPNTGKTFQKSGGGQTIFVRGFDNSRSEDEVRNSLVEHFSSCGEVEPTKVRLPTDRETNSLKGMAYIEFTDANAFTKALELDGSEFGDGSLSIEEAKPRPDRRDSGGGNWRGSSGGGRFNDRDGGRGRGRGRDFGGRGRGGRDSRGRGRGGRDSGRGRRSPYSKPNMVSSGKKTKFDD